MKTTFIFLFLLLTISACQKNENAVEEPWSEVTAKFIKQ